MGISSAQFCVTQGTNEHRRSLRQQAVSGTDLRVPRPPAGISWIGNADMATPSLGRCLLVGLAVGSLAAVAAASAPALGGPLRGITARGEGGMPAPRDRISGRGSVPDADHWIPAQRRAAAIPSTLRFVPSNALHADSATPDADPPQGVIGLLRQLLMGWAADPCGDLDGHANGAWRAQHAPGSPLVSAVSVMQQSQREALLQALSRASVDAGGVEAVLAALWNSALSEEGRCWTTFDPQAAAIAALASREQVERHLCDGLANGREQMLGFRSLFGHGILTAALALQPDAAEAGYGEAADHPAAVAYQQRIAALLLKAGVDALQAPQRAAVIFQMESRLAAVADALDPHDLASAAAALPAFPWSRVWQALGLPADTALYMNLDGCRALLQLLDDHDVADWRGMLLYQEARDAVEFIEASRLPHQLLRQLDHPRVAGLALSDWFAQHVDPAHAPRAQQVFAALKQQFLQDIAVSALDAADRATASAALQAAVLRLDHRGGGARWDGITGTTSFLHNVQVCRRASTRLGLASLLAPGGGEGVLPSAHRVFLASDIQHGEVAMSAAFLAGILADAGAGREAQWGQLGTVLGHELGHILANLRNLGPAGEQLLAQRDMAIQQRIGDVDLDAGGVRLDPARVSEEVGCDLSGISAARRAGRAEAEAAGASFDDARFFEATAHLHAAHPTPSQQQYSGGGYHPPERVRAGLARHVAGFERAFDCDPRPTAPFDRVI